MDQILEDDRRFYKIAFSEVYKNLSKNGVPVEAVLVKDGKIISRRHNQRFQKKI